MTQQPYRMQIVPYSGPLWSGEQPCETLLGLLIGPDKLIVLNHGSPPYAVILGVPHQAAAGVERIAETWRNPSGEYGRPSDEGAALFALAAYGYLCEQGISCKLVIAAHATDHDPNKAAGTPYCQQVFSEPARLLFECHGAGRRRRHSLELSAGTNKLSEPLRFGELLARRLSWRYVVVAQIAPGYPAAMALYAERERVPTSLHLPALATTSLSIAESFSMPALHLEARPLFRISDDSPNTLPRAGRRLGYAIAAACRSYLGIEPG